MSSENGNNNGRVTFNEIRRAARWLSVFTPGDLADALHADLAIGQQAIRALKFHGLLVETGSEIYGSAGLEAIYEIVPLPDIYYPRIKRTPPEISAVRDLGGPIRFQEVGVTQHLINDEMRRQRMSLPGQGHRLKVKEKKRQRMQEAREERILKNEIKQKKLREKRGW